MAAKSRAMPLARASWSSGEEEMRHTLREQDFTSARVRTLAALAGRGGTSIVTPPRR
jgi:hypothetical protein